MRRPSALDHKILNDLFDLFIANIEYSAGHSQAYRTCAGRIASTFEKSDAADTDSDACASGLETKFRRQSLFTTDTCVTAADGIHTYPASIFQIHLCRSGHPKRR